jgi:ABC-type transporter Mla maintaining outer membrane lipid asymmetry permease subunit MlaE
MEMESYYLATLCSIRKVAVLLVVVLVAAAAAGVITSNVASSQVANENT